MSLPLTAALAEERDFLRPGDRVGFLGIGSGLNCLMLGAGVVSPTPYPVRLRTSSTATACACTTSTRARGDPVVMLHGNPTWSFYYRNLVVALCATRYRCIVPDHIGCGLSDKPRRPRYDYTLKRRVDDLRRCSTTSASTRT